MRSLFFASLLLVGLTALLGLSSLTGQQVSASSYFNYDGTNFTEAEWRPSTDPKSNPGQSYHWQLRHHHARVENDMIISQDNTLDINMMKPGMRLHVGYVGQFSEMPISDPTLPMPKTTILGMHLAHYMLVEYDETNGQPGFQPGQDNMTGWYNLTWATAGPWDWVENGPDHSKTLTASLRTLDNALSVELVATNRPKYVGSTYLKPSRVKVIVKVHWFNNSDIVPGPETSGPSNTSEPRFLALVSGLSANAEASAWHWSTNSSTRSITAFNGTSAFLRWKGQTTDGFPIVSQVLTNESSEFPSHPGYDDTWHSFDIINSFVAQDHAAYVSFESEYGLEDFLNFSSAPVLSPAALSKTVMVFCALFLLALNSGGGQSRFSSLLFV